MAIVRVTLTLKVHTWVLLRIIPYACRQRHEQLPFDDIYEMLIVTCFHTDIKLMYNVFNKTLLLIVSITNCVSANDLIQLNLHEKKTSDYKQTQI